jgi:hypothetical protein
VTTATSAPRSRCSASASASSRASVGRVEHVGLVGDPAGGPRARHLRDRLHAHHPQARERREHHQLDPAPPPRERPPPKLDDRELDDDDRELDEPYDREPELVDDGRVRRGVERVDTERWLQWPQVTVTSTEPP